MVKKTFLPRGAHCVRKSLATGGQRQYHYVFRGGPCFWKTGDIITVGSSEYYSAFNRLLQGLVKLAPTLGRGSTQAVVDRYFDSAHFVNLAPRTQSDYRKYLNAFSAEFGTDPIRMFEEHESLAEIREWKNRWANSPKQYDYATSVVTRLLNWAMEEDASIRKHHHSNIARLYSSNRADVVWLPEEVQALMDVANAAEKRILIAASEGGLTPQDIGILTRDHVQRTPGGRRLFFRRLKTSNPVSIPVTPALAELIDSTPESQEYLLVSLTGKRLTEVRASQIVRDLIARANAAAKEDPTKIHIRAELRLYDLRGTAATALLRAGCSLNEIAVTMGWGLRHAANIIEKYAALVPEVSDEVLVKPLADKKKRVKAGEDATPN